MARHLIAIALSVALSGCASRAYVVPTDGPVATIKYRLLDPVPDAGAFTLLDGKCAERKHIGRLQDKPTPVDSKAALTATIPANRPFYTEVFLDVSNATSCGVSWEFVPEATASYEADVTYANEKCDVKLYKVEPYKPQRTELPSPPAKCK